ncbi:MAG: AraC family transcriptional regulator [Gammaproteobacteria bacterium]|nr:AraC family transcriptional regulator [Gammaproteobacteria bacterium]
MVCDRCKLVISNVLNELGISPVLIMLGEVDFGDFELTESQLDLISGKIEPLGFELIEDKKHRIIDSIKVFIIEMVQSKDVSNRNNISDNIKEKFHYDYNYLSNLFSSVEGITIEQFYIHQKIEKVKKPLVYDELNLTAISDLLGYSSVAHLSNQFKKITGLTPAHFKKLRDSKQRKSLDQIAKNV